jgi:hypothetical protein
MPDFESQFNSILRRAVDLIFFNSLAQRAERFQEG